jgi:hypothetical protein
MLRSSHQIAHQHCNHNTNKDCKFLSRPSWSIRGKSSPSTSPSRCQVRLVHRCLNSFSSTQNRSSPPQPRPVNHYVSLFADSYHQQRLHHLNWQNINQALSKFRFIFINSGKSSPLQFLMQVKLGFPSLQTSLTNTMKVYHFKEQLLFKSLLLTFDKTISPSYVIVHHAKITTPSRSPILQPQHQ